MKPIQVSKDVSITKRDSKALNDYISEVSRLSFGMSPDKEADLFMEYRKSHDERIKRILVEHNLRFVISVAKQYDGVSKLTLEDIISEGNIGLLKAVETFDPTLGFHFISYAVFYIRQAILEAMSELGSLVRIPVNLKNKTTHIKRAIVSFEQREYRKPTYDELSEILEIPVDDIATCLALATISSLSSPIKGDEDGREMSDMIEGRLFQNTDESAHYSTIHNAFDEIFKSLTWKEEYIIRRLYGLGTDEVSEEAVADEMHITKERVRQLKVSAKEKIKSNPRVREIVNL
jgi:RNA polymerase primary sigma factor